MWLLLIVGTCMIVGTFVISAPAPPPAQQNHLPRHNVTTLPTDPAHGFSLRPSTHEFRINEARTCGNTPVLLLVVVCSGVDNRDLRAAIRDTWATSVPQHNSKLIFLLALTHNDSIQARVETESMTNRDIVQADFIDSYRNLTLKSIAMLQWIETYCSQAKYVLKSDDDIFINVPLLVKDLQNTIHTRFIMGQLIAGAEPDRNRLSKWYTPETVYAKNRYPEYMSGCAYVISGDIIRDLVKATWRLAPYWIEDVYVTATCATEVGARHVFNAKFGYRNRDACMSQNVITSHRLTPAKMRTLWQDVLAGVHC